MRARIADLIGEDPSPAERAVLAGMLRSFTAKSPAGLDELEAALRAGDEQAAGAQAHTLRGAAGAVGATAFADLLGGLELRARTGGGLPPAEEALPELRAEFARVAEVCTHVADDIDQPVSH